MGMLVLSRLRDEIVTIDFRNMTDEQLLALRTEGPITVCIVDIRGDKVRIGFDAPKTVEVHRKEVYDAVRSAERAEAAEANRPKCPACGQTALDGHITCGNVACRPAAVLP